MSLKDLLYKRTYRTGQDNLINDYYIPVLSKSIKYDRAVGFFSSSILEYISKGLYKFIFNGGKIRLICSVNLNNSDYIKIKEGYDERIIQESIQNDINKVISDSVNDYNIKNLFWLIKENKMDIKLCIRDIATISIEDIEGIIDESNFIYHEKLGVLKDEYENKVAFSGSLNESIYGWKYNYESFDVYTSWDDRLSEWVDDKESYFEELWNNRIIGVKVLEFPDASKKELVKFAPVEPIIKRKSINLSNINFKPRKCQQEAYEFFKNNDYCCLYEMATGSGKTKAALYSMKKIENKWVCMLIVVPKNELIEQWSEDVKIFFPNAIMIKCGSNYKNWSDMLLSVIQAKFPKRVIIISTYDSAILGRAYNKLKEINIDRFASIYDEVHNVGTFENKRLMNIEAKYRIGLSATPTRSFDENGTEKILKFYNNKEYVYEIGDAIQDKYLCDYEYFVIPVYLSDSEWLEYIELSKEIDKISRFNSDKDEIDNETLKRKLKLRSDIIKKCDDKLEKFKSLIMQISKDNRILVYGETKTQLSGYSDYLEYQKYSYYNYFGSTDAMTRKNILENFRLGAKKILLSIGCLDEGIDIPECDTAIFLSSSTSKRQFVQRRGRVLRKSVNKKIACIYDFICIPPYKGSYEKREALKLIRKEYERINIIADDAINGTKTKTELDAVIEAYGVDIFSC